MLARDILHGSSKQPQRVTHLATTTFIIIPPHPTHPTPHLHSARVTCYFKTTTKCHTLQCNYNVYNYPAPPHPPHPTPTQRARDLLLQNNHNVSHTTTTFIIIPPHPTHPTPHPHSARVTCYFKTTTTCHTLQCNYNV